MVRRSINWAIFPSGDTTASGDGHFNPQYSVRTCLRRHLPTSFFFFFLVVSPVLSHNNYTCSADRISHPGLQAVFACVRLNPAVSVHSSVSRLTWLAVLSRNPVCSVLCVYGGVDACGIYKLHSVNFADQRKQAWRSLWDRLLINFWYGLIDLYLRVCRRDKCS